VTVFNCSIAAGRYTSPETVNTFFLRFSIKCFASLAVVVVLPAPCKPAIKITAGGWVARFKSLTVVLPMSLPAMVAINSLLTTATNAWPGLNEPTTSCPKAFSLTRAMKSRTTGKATSASKSASRTSRSMSCTLDSVMRACPRICLTSCDSLSVSSDAIRFEDQVNIKKSRVKSVQMRT